MGIAGDIKSLGEDIVASYDTRIKAIGTLVKDTHQLLKGFQGEHKEMAANLKAGLARGEQDRLKDFKAMMNSVRKFVADMVSETAKLMKGIQKEQSERNETVANLLVKFDKDHEAMAKELRKNLAEGETTRLKDFEAMMSSIQKYVRDVINETKKLIKAIQARQDERNKEVLELLEEFKAEREKMAANWQALANTMAKKRSGKPVVSAGVEVETVKGAIAKKTTVKSKTAKKAGKKKGRKKKK